MKKNNPLSASQNEKKGSSSEATKEGQLYEGMFILAATLSEDARKKAIDKLSAEIQQCDGSVEKIHERGRQKLAYDINGHREGFFYLLYFYADPEGMKMLTKDFLLNEDLVRFMILKTSSVKETIEFKALIEQ